MNLSMKVTLNFREGGDPPVYLIKMQNPDGTWWFVDVGHWSDLHSQAIAFNRRCDAEAAIGLIEQRMKLQDTYRGYPQPHRLSVIEFKNRRGE